jgi:hypothetical protein
VATAENGQVVVRPIAVRVPKAVAATVVPATAVPVRAEKGVRVAARAAIAVSKSPKSIWKS